MATMLFLEAVHAADVSATADLASAYIWRGTTINNGLVMQPSATIAGLPIPKQYGAFTLGTWANYDLARNAADGEREFSEVDYYGTYALPVKVVDLSTTYTEYTYPHGSSADREIAFTVGKAIDKSGLYPSITANYGLDGVVQRDWYIQGGIGYSRFLTEALTLASSVKVAYLIDDGGKDGFNDATVSIGLTYALTKNWAIKGSINYVAQMNDAVLTDTEYDTPIYGLLGVACIF